MTAFRPHPSALSLLLAAGVLLGLQACKSSPPAEPPKAQAPQAPEVDAVPLKAIQEGLRTQEVPAASTLQVWFPAEAAGDESARALLTAPVSGIIASAPAAPGRPLAKGEKWGTVIITEVDLNQPYHGPYNLGDFRSMVARHRPPVPSGK